MKINNFFRINHIYIIIFIISLLSFSLTPKTPNYGWMGVYVAPNFPDLSTGLPIIRFWVPLERFNYALMNNVWLTNNFSYAIFASYIFYMMYQKASKQKTIFFLKIQFPALFFIVFFAAWGGPLYDIVFAFSLLKILEYISNWPQASLVKSTDCLSLGFYFSLLDLSRPTGLPIVLFFLAYIFISRPSFRAMLVFIPLFIFAIPFHIIQYANYEMVTLSVYKGANLGEVFGGYSSINCLANFGQSLIDTLEFAKCSNQMSSEILSNLMAHPYSIFAALSNSASILTILLPSPFWHGTATVLSPMQNLVANLCMNIFLAPVYLLYVRNFRFSRSYISGAGSFFIGFITTILAHNGLEAIRVFMPFILVIIWSSLDVNLKEELVGAFSQR